MNTSIGEVEETKDARSKEIVMEQGTSIEQDAPADDSKEIVEEVTISKFADGTYRAQHFRKLEGDMSEGSNQPGLTRDEALICAAELLTEAIYDDRKNVSKEFTLLRSPTPSATCGVGDVWCALCKGFHQPPEHNLDEVETD